MKRAERMGRRSWFARVIGSIAALTACAWWPGCGPEPDADLAPGVDCTDVSALSDEERAMRAKNEYRDRSDLEDRQCYSCGNWLPPPRSGECGRCDVVPGPIHPAGVCLAWMRAMQRDIGK